MITPIRGRKLVTGYVNRTHVTLLEMITPIRGRKHSFAGNDDTTLSIELEMITPIRGRKPVLGCSYTKVSV